MYADIPETTVSELKELLDGDRAPLLLDVREQDEFDVCHLPGAILVPLSRIQSEGPAALPEGLKEQAQIVCYCKMGGRSGQVTQWLTSQGYTNIKNLTGGVLAWASEIDPDMPTY